MALTLYRIEFTHLRLETVVYAITETVDGISAWKRRTNYSSGRTATKALVL